MQVKFADKQKNQAAIDISTPILRACVHCGMCAATCPSFLISGDERESPRGRIYMIKSMLESAETPGRDISRHIDSCLSCLNCMTTCPSDVNYMHLIDLARVEINKNHGRSWFETMLRKFLVHTLAHPLRMRLGLIAAKAARPLLYLPFLPKQLRAMLQLAPKKLPTPLGAPQAITTQKPTGHIIVLQGCAQRVLNPETHAAISRVLARHGWISHRLPIEGCCGSLAHHMGEEAIAHNQIHQLLAQIQQFEATIGKIDAIIPSASGCGTTIKDYGHALPDNESAQNVADMTRDFTQMIAPNMLQTNAECHAILGKIRCVWHSPCSLQHGQNLDDTAYALLCASGLQVVRAKESHLCCGSAGTYNILQPDYATRLRDRKLGHIHAQEPDIIVTANIGCMSQLASNCDIPILHIACIIDWVSGGPMPELLAPVVLAHS